MARKFKKGENMKYTTLVCIRQLLERDEAQLLLRLNTGRERLRQMVEARGSTEPSAEEKALSEELDSLEHEFVVTSSATFDFIAHDWR
jgi:hypothetical protein